MAPQTTKAAVRRVLLAVLTLAMGCTSNPNGGGGGGPQCQANGDCLGGQVCDGGACIDLCQNDSDCGSGEICVAQRCEVGQRSDPVITGVEGNGPTPDIFLDGIVILGQNLAGGSVFLDGPISAALTVTAETDTRLDVLLPTNIVASDAYTLTVTNAAGSTQGVIALLKGDKGDPATAADVLAMLVTVDGAGSNVDADLLDGRDSTEFVSYSGTDVALTGASRLGVGTAAPAGQLHIIGSLAGRINQDPDPAMVTTSGLTLAGSDASLILDNDTTTSGWHTDTAPGGTSWLRIDLGAGNAEDYVILRLFAGGANYAGVYDIEYSDDGTAWSPAVTRFHPSLAGWNQVWWNSLGAHRYWRLLLTNTPGGGPWLNELELYAVAPGTSLIVMDNGNIGLGTATPQERLDVNGVIRGAPVVGRWRASNNGATGVTSYVWGRELFNTQREYMERSADDVSIQIKIAGFYNVQVNVLQDGLAPGERGDVNLRRNGVDIANSLGYGAAAAYYKHTLSVVEYFEAGDAITVLQASAGAAIYAPDNEWSTLSIHRLN